MQETIAFFESVGCRLQSYRTLRDGKAFDDPTVLAVAAKLNRTPAQVIHICIYVYLYVYIYI